MESELILNIGTDHFPEVLFAKLRAPLSLRHLVAYRYMPNRPVTLLMSACDEAERPSIKRAIDLYSRFLFRYDPFLPEPSIEKARNVSLRHIEAENIDDSRFRDELYRAHDMASKTAVVIRRPQDCIVVNMLRGNEAGAMTDGQIDFVHRATSVVAAAVERHVDLTHRAVSSVWSALLERTSDCPRLSQREALVCSQILEGYYNEGIALNLAISVHSVITYRRRAFAKLGITSQNELFTLVMKSRLH